MQAVEEKLSAALARTRSKSEHSMRPISEARNNRECGAWETARKRAQGQAEAARKKKRARQRFEASLGAFEVRRTPLGGAEGSTDLPGPGEGLFYTPLDLT